MDKPPSRLPFACFRPPFSLLWPGYFYGEGSKDVSANTLNSKKPIARSQRGASEGGFLLVFLLPVLVLLAAFLLGSLRFSEQTQAKVALQSRLDVCAVRLAVARERFYGRLSKANEGVNDSKLAIYSLRAATLLPGAGEAAVASQEALLELNETLATAEEGLVAASAAEEIAGLRCAPTAYSQEQAFCVVTPPLASALEREKTLFSDVRGTLGHRKRESSLLAKIRCSGPAAATVLAITGDAAIRQFKGYEDAYLPTP